MDPDGISVDGMGFGWDDGVTFGMHPDFGFLIGDVTHYRLVEREVRDRHPEINATDLKALAYAEYKRYRWSGRYWELPIPDDPNPIRVAMWQDDEYLPAILREMGGVVPFDVHTALYVERGDDMWLTYSEIMETPNEKPIPDPDNGTFSDFVAKLRMELHTADPGRKDQIRSILRAVGQDALPDDSSKRRGGFDTPAQRNFAMGESGPTDHIPFNKRLGRCYELSGKHAQGSHDSILVHGSIEGMGHPRIRHAWVVTPEGVWEPCSNVIWPVDAFKGLFHPIIEHQYGWDEMLDQTVRTGHWGPWDDLTEGTGQIGYDIDPNDQPVRVLRDLIHRVGKKDALAAWHKAGGRSGYSFPWKITINDRDSGVRCSVVEPATNPDDALRSVMVKKFRKMGLGRGEAMRRANRLVQDQSYDWELAT